MRLRALVPVALVFGLAAPAQAALGPVVASYGNWDLHRGSELMSGGTVCTAVYRRDPGVQLNRDALYVKASSYRNPHWYRYRIDDDPVVGPVAASALIWKMRAVVFEGAPFNRIVRARRLRIEVVNRHSAVQFDLDLDGIYSAYGAVYHCR